MTERQRDYIYDPAWESELMRLRALPAASIETAAELTRHLLAMVGGRGIQTSLGRHLPALLVDAGLENVGAEGRTNLMWGGSEEAEVGRLSVEHVTKVAVDAGVFSEADRARYLAVVTDPDTATFSPFRFGAWGRKRPVSG